MGADRGQCQKWRTPVKYRGTPDASAAAMTSSSPAAPPDGPPPGLGQPLEPVSKRKVRVAGRDRSGRPVARSRDGQPGGIDTVDLAHADPHRGHAGREQDRIGLAAAPCPPREL